MRWDINESHITHRKYSKEGNKATEIVMNVIHLSTYLRRIVTFQKRTNSTQSAVDSRQRLLEVSLNYVKQNGWCEECILKAAADLNMPNQSYKILRRGIAEVVQHFYDDKRKQVYMKITQNRDVTFESKPNLEIVEEALNAHLDGLIPFRDVLGDAISVALHPREWPYSLYNLYANVDDLCHFADIKCSRLDWYAERLLMCYLYCSMELYFLTDPSVNGIETR
jgi:rpsU-divergently transcribed protein